MPKRLDEAARPVKPGRAVSSGGWSVHTDRVAPSLEDSFIASATKPIGGPLGEHAVVGRHWFWSPLRVSLLFAVLALMLCWFGKASCIQQFTNGQGQNELDWRSGRPYVAMCYSDIVPLYSGERLDKPGEFPYQTKWIEDEGTATPHERYMEYPVLSGLFQWVNAKITSGWVSLVSSGWLPGALPVAIYFNITAFFLAAAWLITVWAVSRTSSRRPWDAVLVAISPLVLVHAFTNFDAIATAFTALGLLAWSRKKPVLTGVFLGIGAAAKLYPLLLLGPLLILCLRAGKGKTWLRTSFAAAGTWLAINLPIAILFFPGWGEFFRINSARAMDPDSIYNVISHFTGWAGFDGILHFGQTPLWLNIVSAVLFLLCCGGIAYVGLSAPIRPRVGQLCFLVIAAFLLTSKVWSPQYSLWLVPLAVLAIPRWRLLLVWMTLDALVWVPRMFFYLGPDHRGLPEDWFLSAVILRDLAVLGLCVMIIREIYQPTKDVIRANGGEDDPIGGFLNRARDRFIVSRRLSRQSVFRV